MIWWKALDDMSLLHAARDNSFVRPQVIFKNSTRCSVSSGALSRLNRNDDPENADFYLLDLIRYRHISNEIAEQFGITHESPQLLLIWQGKVVYHESHSRISFDELDQQIGTLTPAENKD